MEYFFSFMIGIIILLIFTIILKLSAKIIIKLLMNALAGGIAIFLINFFGGPFGIYLDLSLFSATVVGIFGLFGVILLFIFG